MKNRIARIAMSIALSSSAMMLHAQVLNLSISNLTGNVVRITGTAAAPGFTSGSATSWGAMGITLRIPKSATTPAPTNANTGSLATNITAASTAFTGATPADAATGTPGLSAFDLTSFGLADDNYWYFQISETTPGGNQLIPSGGSVTVYQFTVPSTWHCTSCMEIVTIQIPGAPISTIPFIDNASTGGNVISVTNASSPLPITLLDFTASKTNDSRVQLNWQTPFEQGSDYFEVERSKDGAVFDETVAHIRAAGTSASLLNYQTYDVDPLPGDNFYRLKMVNAIGLKTYSSTRKVHFDDLFAGVIVYPTDNKDGIVRVTLPVGMDQASISLIDAVGRSIPVSVTGTGTQRMMNLQGLPSGNYMVNVMNGLNNRNFKMVYHP